MPDPIPLEIPPGVLKRDSPAAAGGRYIDAQWVRFRNRRAEKIGGYVAMFSEALMGVVRGMLAWTTKSADDVVAAGTHIKLYSTSDTVDDITPLDDSGTLGSDPFDTTDTSDIVTVNHTSHGREEGCIVRFSGATAGGGITIDGDYTVVTKTSDNAYTIQHSSAATSTTSGGGANVDYEYELNPGLQDTSYGVGWGAGGWNEGTWNTARSISDGVLLESRYWFFGEYGSTLLALPSGETLYQWDEPNNDDRAAAVSNAPASARAMFVTSERFPVLLGTSTPMTIAWPDQSDITDWTPSASNTARTRTLQHGSRLVAGTALGELVGLIWSDTSLYLMQYTGTTFVYDTRHISDACGLIAPGGYVVVLGVAYWFSKGGLLMFQGGISPIPNSADWFDFITANMNEERTRKMWCGYVPKKNEIWWGYCSTDAAEPDRYVAVSLDDYSWTGGTLARTGMSHHSSPTGRPVMAGDDMIIYEHEVGVDADGAAIEAYIETGIVPLQGAGRDTEIFGFIPDFERQSGTISLVLSVFENPMSASDFDSETNSIEEGDEIVDTHLCGRYVKMRLSTNEIGGDFRMGVPLLDPEPGGER